MKRYGLSFYLSVALFYALLIPFPCAQSTAAVNENSPGIEFEKTTHQFGDLFQNENHSYSFRFKNAGNQPLKILNVAGT
jgi:hypothetical protein